MCAVQQLGHITIPIRIQIIGMSEVSSVEIQNFHIRTKLEQPIRIGLY